LRRSIQGEWYQDPGGIDKGPLTGDDTSSLEWNWNEPSSSSGKVYDWDDPGEYQVDGYDPTGLIYRLRDNFTEYAVLGDQNSTESFGNSLQIFSRSSCAKLASGSQLDTTYAGDNIAGAGSTKTTINLQ
jgi:hypothetical protein